MDSGSWVSCLMSITPSEIFILAITRHQKPWNWSLHFAGLIGFALSLLFHSYLLFATSLIFSGAGFFDLKLPPVPESRWLRFVASAVEWEKNWVAAPWSGHKIRRMFLVVLIAAITVWALWTKDGVVLSLLVGFAYLFKIMKENMEGGIDP